MPQYLVGLDEVGTGAYAGPAFVCAAVVTRDWVPPKGLTDSKDMSWTRKARVYGKLIETITDFRLISIPSTYIDEHGLHKAWLDGVGLALSQLIKVYPQASIIIDGAERHPDFRCTAMPKADKLVPVVSAASVIAKVNRDMLMIAMAKKYPGYEFEKNVGYGTRGHWNGLHRRGVTPIHRRSYRPIQRLELAQQVSERLP